MYTNDDTLHFIAAHRNDNVPQLALAAHNAPNVDLPFALDQIACWQTACRKLPAWAKNPNIVYPPHLSLEQCSSQTTAEYKANVAWHYVNAMQQTTPNNSEREKGNGDKKQVAECEHTSLVDLTGGFGVDFCFMAAHFAQATYVERQSQLCQLVQNNLNALNMGHAKVVCAEAESHLETMERVSCIYLDPARREGDDQHRRVYAIEDCEPDLWELLPRLRSLYASLGCPLPRLLVKLSPMLDITHTLQSVPYVTELHIVAVRGEVKELLLSLDLSLGEEMPEVGAVSITAANLLGSERPAQIFTQPCALAHEGALTASYATELSTYLYEPNAALMKSGLFKTLAETFALQPLHPSTHLYTSSHRVMDFPGRVFEVRAVHPFASSILRRLGRELGAAQISCRNFPLSPEALRAKLGIKDSDAQTLFALTLSPSIPLMVLCHRL